MNELSKNQKIAYSTVATGIGGVATYYGTKNWKKNGWWKTLAVLGVMQTTGGLYNIAVNSTAPNTENQLNN